MATGTYSAPTVSHAGASTSARVRWVGATQPVVGGGSNTKISGGTVQIRGNYIDWVWTEITGGQAGLSTYNPVHDNRILSNYIHDMGALSACSSSGSALYVDGTSSPNEAIDPNAGWTLVNGNIIDRVWGYNISGCQNDGIYGLSKNNTITNNVVSRAAGWGIHFYHAAGNEVVSNNTVFNNARGGIEVSNSDTTMDFNSMVNNIIINNGYNGGQYGIQEYGSNCTIVGSHNLYAHNLMFGNTPATGNTPGTTASIFVCPGHNPAVGTLTQGSTGSLFVNYTGDASGDYHLKSGSPAIGAGTVSCANGLTGCIPQTDFASLQRPSRLSVGAFEFGGVVNDTQAPTPPSGLTATVQ